MTLHRKGMGLAIAALLTTMLLAIMTADPAAAVCLGQCKEAKSFCESWEKSNPGKECGRVRGYVCTGKNWKRIKIVNSSWSACELVGGTGDFNKALARCEEYEENWGGNCKVHSPLCAAGWVSLSKYGSFRACRPRSASGSLRYDLYQLFMRRWEGRATIPIPEHLRPFLTKQYGIDVSSIRWGRVGDQPNSTCITDCDKIYCDSQPFIDAISSGYGWDAGQQSPLAFHELAHVMQCRQKGGRKQYAEYWFENLRKGLGIGIKNFGVFSKKRREEMVDKVHDDMPMEKAAEEKGRTVMTAYLDGWWHKPARCRVYAPDKTTIVHESTNEYPRYDCDPEFNRPVYQRLVADAKKKMADAGGQMGTYHVALGKPHEDNGAWLGTYQIAFAVKDATPDVKVSGDVCPKPAAIKLVIAAEGRRKLRVRHKIGGDWVPWKEVEIVKFGIGYIGAYNAAPDRHLAPGTHRVDFQIDGYDKPISTTVDVDCPPFRITNAQLLSDTESGYLCPRKLTTREIYLANGPGQFRKRHEREGSEPGDWTTVSVTRDGNRYLYRTENTQEVGEVDQKRRVVAQPRVGKRWRVESDWTPFLVKCLKIEDSSITYIGPNDDTCPFKTRAQLRIVPNLPIPVPYRLDCADGQSVDGTFSTNTATSGAHIGQQTVNLDVTKTGKLACALKVDRGKGMLPVTLQGADVKCNDVLDAAVYIDGPDETRCPATLPVRVRVNARDTTPVPYRLDCTNGESWDGIIDIARTGPNTYIGVTRKDLRVTQTGKVACALKSSLTGWTRVIALRGKDIQCVTPQVPTPPPTIAPPSSTPPTPPRLVCDGGTPRGERCVCPRSATLKRVAQRRYACEAPPPIVCTKGTLRGDRCVCPGGWSLKRVSDRNYACDEPPRTVCDNGTVRANRCVCQRGWTMKRVAANNFACTKPIPLGCVGGKAVGNNCVCPRGAQKSSIGPNAFRCACPSGTKLVRNMCIKAAN